MIRALLLLLALPAAAQTAEDLLRTEAAQIWLDRAIDEMDVQVTPVLPEPVTEAAIEAEVYRLRADAAAAWMTDDELRRAVAARLEAEAARLAAAETARRREAAVIAVVRFERAVRPELMEIAAPILEQMFTPAQLGLLTEVARSPEGADLLVRLLEFDRVLAGAAAPLAERALQDAQRMVE